jgi:hypothetical protein
VVSVLDAARAWVLILVFSDICSRQLKFLAVSPQWQHNTRIRREEMMQRARLNLVAILYVARACAVAAVLLVATSLARAQVASLSKGQQILVDRGLQINGVVALTSDPFHLSTLQSTNFTAPLWAWTSDVSKLGSAPGAPWAKWFDYTTQNDLTAAESPYRSNLVQLYVGDEQYLNTPSIFADTDLNPFLWTR